MMELETRKMVFRAIPVICLLAFSVVCSAFFWLDDQYWRSNLGSIKVDKGGGELESWKYPLRRLVQGEDQKQLEATGFVCHSDFHYDICVATKPIRINAHSLTIYVYSNLTTSQDSGLAVQPYPRKEDGTAMKLVTPLHVLHGNDTSVPTCSYTHNVPAVVFSSGGFTGNLFHEFNEVIIPLFITTRHFKSHLQFLVTDFKLWFMNKYSQVFSHLSNFQIMNLSTMNGNVHCFPGAVVGLKFHGNLALNSSDTPGGNSMLDFKNFLRESYNLKVKNVILSQKPVLVLVSRQETRVFLNEHDMVKMMEDMGFQVIISRPKKMSDLKKFGRMVNSCSVMVGAHGAGLTNGVFLPNGAVMVQVVPLGLTWASNAYFGEPAPEMGLKYLEYKIGPEESSLFELYGSDHPVVTDPSSVFAKGYEAARAMYVDGQNLKINLARFRETLAEALRLLGTGSSNHPG